jgi:hypothetical protein
MTNWKKRTGISRICPSFAVQSSWDRYPGQLMFDPSGERRIIEVVRDEFDPHYMGMMSKGNKLTD